MRLDFDCFLNKKINLTHLCFYSIAEEECHHASVDLVLEHPGGPRRGLCAQEGEGVEGGEDAEDHSEL